jgi:ABC-type glycerol-3-phosphate transport system substrate-binding protein
MMIMTPRRPAMIRLIAPLLGLCLLAWLAGCTPRGVVPTLGATQTAPAAGASTASAAHATPAAAQKPTHAASPPVAVAATPLAESTAAPQDDFAVTSTAPITDTTIILNWWTPEFISPKATQPAGPLLTRYLAEFEQAQQGKVRVRPVLKAKYGKGGLLDLMRTGQTVAPSILPDVIALDTAELEQAAASGLLQPLDALLDPALVKDLYPFARQAGEFDGHLLAVQFVADLDHVVYNRAQVGAPPQTWAGLMANKITYLFPAGNPQPASAAGLAEDVQPVFLSQYLSAGGVIKTDTRQLTWQEAPLLRVLAFYNDIERAGLLPAKALDTTSPEEAWTLYAQGAVSMTTVSARQYLAGQESLPNSGFAPLPGWSGPATPIARGWALAITTADPARQRAAAALIEWLLSPERAGGWAQAAGWLPVIPLSRNQWGTTPYHDFLLEQLALAVSHPIGSTYPQTASQMRKAMLAVLKDHVSPEQAIQSINGPPAAR